MPPTLEKHALVQECMDAEVQQFCNDTSTQIKNLLARAQEFLMTNRQRRAKASNGRTLRGTHYH